MNKIAVKICGLKTEVDVKTCMDLGVDILGFVTEYPIDVPWNLTREQAKILLALVKPNVKTCLVTGGNIAKIIQLADFLRPSIIQLHYNETFAETKEIASVLKQKNIQTIKTMPTTLAECMKQFGTANTQYIVESLCKTGIFAILVDSRTPDNAGQLGTTIDFDFYSKIKALSSKPVILAGGITPENIKEIIKKTRAEYIDVMTGVEKSPGVKDKIKLINMLSIIK